jgi:rubrerythrin
MLKLFVCQVCGEPYLGRSKPDDCPFCGAPAKYIGRVEEYTELWKEDLNEQEKKDLQATLALEVNAAGYYTTVGKTQGKYSKYGRLFKQLARVEKEHAEVAAKFIDVELPEFKGEDSKGSIEADLERTKQLEENAVKEYQEFLGRASSDKVKKFFEALIHAEQGHFDHVSQEI